MILTKKEIVDQINAGDITITPFVERFLTPNGYDLHLGRNLIILSSAFDGDVMDPKQDLSHFYERFTMSDSGYLLQPGTFVLGVTVEHTQTPYHVPIMEGNSTNGRMGLETHICAGMGDIGFSGFWTTEMRATKPVRIYPGMPIGQLVFFQTSDNGGEAYGDKPVSYNNEITENPWPVIPNLHLKPEKFFDFENDGK